MRFLTTAMAALVLCLSPLSATRAQELPGVDPDGDQHLIIYHAESRRSERIVWLAEELGIPYQVVYLRGDVGGSFALIRQVNPTMPTAPTVIYDGQLLMESGAIIQLILAREGEGRLAPPVSSPDYPAYLLFMNFAEGTLAADAVADYRVARATDGLAPRGEETDGQRAMRYADNFLAAHPYFGGPEFSAADIMMVFPISYATRMNVADMAQYPNVAEWLARVESRPAFLRMLAAARPDGRVSPPPALRVE
jgi:glutathione S-transferase